MYNSDTELVFPLRVVPSLDGLRGDVWKELVRNISGDHADPMDQTGFVLMVARLTGCAACNADSFRAMRGCTTCARQSIKRYRGSDQELIHLFSNARVEVVGYYDRLAVDPGANEITGV